MLRTLGKIVVGLVAVVLLAAAALYAKASSQISKVWDIPSRPIAVTADSATVERGRHLASAIFKCTDCHGADLGRREPFADAGPLGVVNSANLTRGEGGVIAKYDDAALARTIRHGVRLDGTAIPIMPAGNFITASDEDVAAVIAYVRSVPAVDRKHRPSTVKPLGMLLYGAGQFPIYEADLADHSTTPARPVVAPTAEYGKYLAGVGGCTGCHGPGLSGGKIPGTPPDWKPAANISPEGLKGWSEADFVSALKTGIRPNKTPIDTLMPWRLAGQMDSTEMRAIWRFIQSVPPKAYGGR